MSFRTKLDYSDNRQIQQRPETHTILSGGTAFGMTFSALTTGPDLSTSAITSFVNSAASTFSGNSATTVYNWYDPSMALGYSSLTAITPSTSANTQYTTGYSANTTTVIDGNTVALDYVGVYYDITCSDIYDLGGGNYSGTAVSLELNFLTAGTLDYTGRTIWVDVSGMTRTRDLIITNNPIPGLVWICEDYEGRGYWGTVSAATSGMSVWTLSSNPHSAVLIGSSSVASGNFAVAEGNNNLASGNESHAEGDTTTASGPQAHSEGNSTTASGAYSHAEGYGSIASGPNSHAEGWYSIASGDGAHAEGGSLVSLFEGGYAEGDASHAEGGGTTASNDASHAEGWYTVAVGSYSHSEGYVTTANGMASHAEGAETIASGDYSHSEGQQTTSSGTNSHAEGSQTTASGFAAHAEGILTIASGTYSHAEGDQTTALGGDSHAEGTGTLASGTTSHAEGGGTKALGNYSHSEGYQTTAIGYASHAGGTNSIANGDYSFVHGNLSYASGSTTIVLGSSVTGTSANTVYVNALNIKTVGSTAFANDIRIDANGNLTTNTSDLRLKENITPISGALNTIKSLQGVSYQWKDRNAGTDAVRLGFIAQDVDVVDSRLAFTNPIDGYMGLHIDGIIPLLVEAVKEISSGSTNTDVLQTQTIVAEDNNIDLNYGGTQETALEGGIRVLHAKGVDMSAEFLTDANGDWVTNNDLKPNQITIPLFTPSGSTDTTGNLGNITRDDAYIYVKCSDGWKRSNLESF